MSILTTQLNLDGTYATGPVNPGGSGSEFLVDYTITAKNIKDLDRVKLTLSDANESRSIRFFQDGYNITWKQDIEDRIDLSGFFHPLQDFSGYQKQTFVIEPKSYIYLDPGYFSETNGNIGFLFARAYYLPKDNDTDQHVLYWNYGPTGSIDSPETYIMGELLCLSGTTVEDGVGKGWNSEGFHFTNPTDKNVKLKIITAN